METSTFVEFVSDRCRVARSGMQRTLASRASTTTPPHSSPLISGACCSTMSIIPLIVRDGTHSSRDELTEAAEKLVSREIGVRGYLGKSFDSSKTIFLSGRILWFSFKCLVVPRKIYHFKQGWFFYFFLPKLKITYDYLIRQSMDIVVEQYTPWYVRAYACSHLSRAYLQEKMAAVFGFANVCWVRNPTIDHLLLASKQASYRDCTYLLRHPFRRHNSVIFVKSYHSDRSMLSVSQQLLTKSTRARKEHWYTDTHLTLKSLIFVGKI